jgi:hypothetical protein
VAASKESLSFTEISQSEIQVGSYYYSQVLPGNAEKLLKYLTIIAISGSNCLVLNED